jgi:hypothetical protein
MMRHCRQCRADAVGLLGEDRGAEFTLDKIDAPMEKSTTRRRWSCAAEEVRDADHQPNWPKRAAMRTPRRLRRR